MANNCPNANHRKRLRERYDRDGADSLEEHELLELFLFDAIPRVNTNPIAHALIDRFGSLDGVLRADKSELMTVRGIGERSAEYISSTFAEMRLDMENSIFTSPVASFEKASNVLIWHRLTLTEQITVLALDGEHRVVRIVDTDDGTPDGLLRLCFEVGARKAIIGVGKSCQLTVEVLKQTFEESKVKLCDIIMVDEYRTESIM